MTYKEAVEYLYNATPQFQQIGAAAYKPGLDTVRRLSRLNGESHKKYPTIHIAGTNGKGSTAHTIAAVMQSAGYRV
ncbi:MAG: bifunctional folylpolyglutamate synthase/dihydrofolate synthase, partial [Muribaculaceae bacterium]|nr:bifunctional folylpolyglutamate synthase/dihydrofolate synthase [Muribaculaceae bacterium]